MKPNQPISTSTPYYEVRCPGWDHLQSFDNAKEAYQAAFELALQFPNTVLFVYEKVNWKERIILRLNINLNCGIDNIQDFYKSMVELFQNKIEESSTWRKADGH